MRTAFVFHIVLLAMCFTACSQSIKLAGVKPQEIKAYDSDNSNDSGVRTLEVTLRLSGRGITTRFPLTIDTSGVSSKPKLLDSVILVESIAFPGRRSSKEVNYKVNIQLTPLNCLQTDEAFEMYKSGPKPPSNLRVTIKKFTIPSDKTTITLKQDSSILAPFIKDDAAGGTRTVILTVVLSGKTQPATDAVLSFSIPSYIPSASSPQIQNSVSITVPKTTFPTNGCPVKIKVPLVIKLSQTERTAEERIPILLAGDDQHAHFLIIRSEIKPAAKADKTVNLKDTGFTHACINRNFMVKIKPDSIGGRVEVTEERTQKKATYQFNNFFRTGDFAQWFFNVFSMNATNDPCNDCALCVNYITERVYEELLAAKKPGAGGKLLTDAKSIASKTDTAKDTTKKKDSVNAQKAGIPDTITYKSAVSYADTSLYAVEINRLKTKTDIKLCKDPKKGKDSCYSYSVAGDLDKGSYNRAITQLLQKFRGEEQVNVAKISPVPDEQFEKYSEALEQKNPKEKPEAQKHLDEILKNDSLTHTKVGIIYLKDSLINIYDTNGVVIKKTKIDSVMFTIEDGKLVRRELLIETKDGTFTNKRAPISVLRLNDRGMDILVNEEPDKTTFVRLKDVLKYRAYGGYTPDDLDNAVLSPKKPAKVLTAASNLNSLINFSIFTDIPGLLGRRANGIINTEITGRFITNTGNFSNIDRTPLAYIETNFILSKFDSKFKSIDSFNIKANLTTHQDTVDRMQLMQTAWLKGSVKFNIFSTRLRSSQYFQFNIGGRINIVNADSLYRREADIIFFDYYPEFLYSVKRLKNFGMDLSLRWLFQRLADKESFSNKGLEVIFSPQAAFYYYPSSNSSSKIYLRFNYFANRDKLAKNFYQLQFGYKTSLKLSK